MVFGIDDALIGAGIGAIGSTLGGYFSGKGSGKKQSSQQQVTQESRMDRKKRHLVDQLLSSLNGKGPYSDLYNADENAFQKSFVQPALSRFNNQIAPQIQQQYIASGQQRGTGLEDQLLRAGVDLDSLLNQHMMEFQQGAQNRQQNAINSILGTGSNAGTTTSTFNQPGSSNSNALGNAVGGYLSSSSFTNSVDNIFKPQQANSNTTAPQSLPPRRGFQPDWTDWKLGDKRWGTV